MNGDRWVCVTPCDNIPLREGRLVRLAGHDIAVFNLGDRFVATENRCPHEGGPLCDGIVAGTSVVCPLHAWKISLDSGLVERPRTHACVRTYATLVEHGMLFLEMVTNPKAELAI